MVAWRCRLKKRLIWMVSLMTVTSIVMMVRVHLNQVRKTKTELIYSILGSRNTSEFVNPGRDTILFDSTIAWVSPRAAANYPGLGNLIQEQSLFVGESRTQPSSQPPFVLIVVVSEFGFEKNRQAIRETWGRWARRENAKVVFFLGLPAHTNTTMSEIDKEVRRYKDVVVDDHLESYYLLAVKILRVLKWFNSSYPTEKSRPSFLVKTDHDVFNHVPNLVRHLKGVTTIPDYIGGLLHTKAPVIRDGYSKWFTPPELWSPEYYPWYVGGPCYILSGSLIPQIYEAGLKEPLFHLEDVFVTGIVGHNLLGSKLHGLPEDLILQSTEKLRLYDSNLKDFFSFHPVTPVRMHQYYRRARRLL